MSLLDEVRKSNTYITGSSTGGTLLDSVKGNQITNNEPIVKNEPPKKTGFFQKFKDSGGVKGGLQRVKELITKRPKELFLPTSSDPYAEEGRKFVARTGVAAAQLATETIDFAADFLSSAVEDKIRKPYSVTGAPFMGIKSLPGEKKENITLRSNIADRWRDFYDNNVGSNTEKLKKFTDDLSKVEYIKPSEEWSKAPLKEKFTSKLPETVLNIGPGVVASLGSFVINPALGFVVSSGSTADQVSTIAKESGVPKEKAELLGLGTGLLVGFLDKVVPEEILSSQEKKLFIGALAKKVAITGLKESTTEMVQEGVQILVEDVVKKDLNFDDAKTRIIMAGFGGFLGGTSMSSIAGFINNIRSGDIADIKAEDIKTAPTVDVKIDTKAGVTLPEEITTLGEDTTVYRGAKDQTIDVTRPQGITNGVSFSTDEKTAQRFADKVGGTVASQTISKDAKVINLSTLESIVGDVNIKEKNLVATEYLKRNDIDVVRIDTKDGQLGEAELVVVNDRVLKPMVTKTPVDNFKTSEKLNESERNIIATAQKGAREFKTEAEFVSDKVFGTSIPGVDKAAVEKAYPAESFSESLSLLYRDAKRSEPVTYDAGKVEGYSIGKPRQYRTIEEGNKVKTVEGIPVKIIDGVDTFLRQGDGGWVVSEATTGRYISESRTQGAAIAKADTIINQKGIEEFKKAIEKNKLPQTPPLSPTKRGVSSQAQITTPPPAKAIKLENIKPVKRGVFTANNRTKVQQEIGEVISASKTQEEAVKKIDKLVSDHLNDVENPIYQQKLIAVKAELKKQMYTLVGANTGDYKKDYAYFLSQRSNPEVSTIIDKLEDSLLQIDEVTNTDAPSSSLGHASTGAISVGEFEQRSAPKRFTEEFKLYEKVKALTQKYAATIGEGYTPRKALGVYYTKTKNIRVNSINNLSVATHEITHFLDEKFNISSKLMAVNGYSENGKPIYNPLTKKYRKEITDLYVKYYPGGKKTHSLRTRTLEGFATLLQKYTESPKTIESEYPILVRDFLKEGGKYYHPVMGEIVSDLNQIVEGYQGLKALDKIGSKVTSDDINVDKKSFLSLGDKIRQFLADEIYPTEVLAKMSGTFMTREDPSLWLRAYNSISGLVNNNISTDRGYWTISGDGIKKIHDFNWKTLVDMTKKTNSTDDFGYYLVARREYYAYLELDELKAKMEAETENYKNTPNDLKHAKDENGRTPADILKEAEDNYESLKSVLDKDGITREEATLAHNENKDRFVEETKMFDTLTRSDLDFMVSEDVQLITPQQYENLGTQKGYASFKRQFYDDIVGDNGEITGTAKVGKTKVASLLKRKGSERTIINPLYNGITNHSEILRKGTKQIVYNKFTNIGVSAAFPNLFQELDLKVAIDKQTGAFTYPQEKDPNIIMGRSAYKRKPILIDGQLKSVIDNILTYDNVDVFVKLYTGLSRMFTAGTTGFYPQFAATNFLRDQITAQVNTENKFKSLYSPLKTFGVMLGKKDSQAHQFYQEYLIMGGERQTFTGWQKLPPKELFRVIANEKKALEKAIEIGEKATDVLSLSSKYSELVTRASEYIAARKSGQPPIVALEQAGRLTAPFHHLGSWGGKMGQTFIRGLPFFNASLQVLDQHARVAGTAKGRQRLAFVVLAITAGYLASIMKLLRATDEQKDQYRDLTPEELSQFLYFPHPSGQKLIRVPMANTFTQLGTIINMVIADKVLDTKYKGSDYVQAATAWLPDQFNITEPVKAFLSWIPQIFKTGVETVVGVKTFPRVSSLESQSLKTLPPGMRTTENTSKFAKWLGSKTNLSPIKIDYLITGYLGRAMGFVTGVPSAYKMDSSVVRDYWFSSGRRVNGMYELKTTNEEKYNAYQKHKLELSKEEEMEVYRVYVLSSKFSDVMNDYRDVDIEKDQEKAAKLRNEALHIMEMIENGDKPTTKYLPKTYSSFSDWVSKARKRRKENE